MKNRIFLLAGLLVFSTAPYANDQFKQEDKFKQMMDRAAEMARNKNVTPAVGARTAPSKEQINQALDQAAIQSGVPGSNIGELVDRAYVRQQQGAEQKNTAALTAAKIAESRDPNAVDPAEIAKLYRKPAMQGELSGPKEELVVFISTSIPADALKVIGAQAKRYGAVLVIRGIAGGFNGQNLKNTMRILKAATDQGADVQIHPDLFRRYGVTAVPTTILSSAIGKGCEEGFCTEHASLIGDVTIEYALEQFAKRRDVIGRIANERLEKARIQQ